jgi:hypothetical protein
MRKTLVTYICDICSNTIDNQFDLGSHEKRTMALIELTIDVWYQGKFSTNHICIHCQESILKHIKLIHGKFDHRQWTKKETPWKDPLV